MNNQQHLISLSMSSSTPFYSMTLDAPNQNNVRCSLLRVVVTTLTYPLRSLRGVPFLESALLLLLTSTRAYFGSSSPKFELPALPFSGRGGIGGGGGGGRQGDDSSRSCSASKVKSGWIHATQSIWEEFTWFVVNIFIWLLQIGRASSHGLL